MRLLSRYNSVKKTYTDLPKGEGYLYAIWYPPYGLKVGSTDDLPHRLAQHRLNNAKRLGEPDIFGSHDATVLGAIYIFPWHPVTKTTVETEICNNLPNFGGTLIKGREWFMAPKSTINTLYQVMIGETHLCLLAPESGDTVTYYPVPL